MYLGLAILLCGCATTFSNLKPEEKKQIQERVFQSKYDSVFRAISSLFEERGFTIDKSDKESGFVSTDWKQGSEINKTLNYIGADRKAKITAYVTKIDENKTSVKMNIAEQEINLFGQWANADINADKVKKIYNEYFDTIQNNIK